MPTEMAETPDVTAPLFGGAHGETPEMVEMAEIPETLETFELETCVMPETTGTPGTCGTHATSGIQETCGTLVMFETFVTHGSRCMIDTGIHGI